MADPDRRLDHAVIEAVPDEDGGHGRPQPNLLAPVILLKPTELADLAGEDEDCFAFLQWLCAERASDTFRADMSLGPDDPVPYWPADLWPMRLTRRAHGSRRRPASSPETPHVP